MYLKGLIDNEKIFEPKISNTQGYYIFIFAVISQSILSLMHSIMMYVSLKNNGKD